jgi:hypothetical protein
MRNPLDALREHARLHPNQARLAFLLAFAAYGMFLRFPGVHEQFYFYGDQCLAWDYVGRPFSKLPLVGVSCTDGIYAWGPIYYWWIWLVRAVVGPWYHDMPVATALPTAVLCGASEVFLLYALMRRKTPWPACLGYALLTLSSSYFNSLATQPWNPSFTFALTNFALGSTLLLEAPAKPWQTAVIAALCVFAAQAHPAAVVIPCSILPFLVLYAARRGSARQAATTGLVIVATAFVLMTPYLAARIITPEFFQRKSVALQSLGQILLNPSLISFSDGFSFVFGLTRKVFTGWLPPLLATAAMAAAALAILVRRGIFRPDFYVCVFPLLGGALGFSLYKTGLNKYWLVTFLSCTYLAYVLGLLEPLASSSRRLPRLLAWALVAVLAWQHVASLGEPMERYPYYGVMERAAFRLAKEGREIRGLLPPEIDAYEKWADSRNFNHLARWAGVKINPQAKYYVEVDQQGELHFKEDLLPGNRIGFPESSEPPKPAQASPANPSP